MPITRFIRTTHNNGQFRSFPPEAIHFWREQGVIVGEVLRPECALTFGTRGREPEAHSVTDFCSDSFTTRRNLAGLGGGHMARMGMVVIAGVRGRGNVRCGVCGRDEVTGVCKGWGERWGCVACWADVTSYRMGFWAWLSL